MKCFSIVYVGPVFSGRRTSLSDILSIAGQNYNPLTLMTDAAYECDFVGTRIAMGISYKRSMLPDRHQFASKNDDIEREMEWLARADGIVFVIDSQRERLAANVEQLDRLRRDLSLRNVDIENVPLVFQANKRELKSAVPIDILRRDFRTRRSIMVETIAVRGIGTSEAVHALLREISDSRKDRKDPDRS